MLQVLCWACAAATLFYKGSTGRLIYLLQPCHLSNALLLLLTLLPRGSRLATWLFFFNLHTAYGTWMAVLMPDLKNLILPGEVLYFFTQHGMLLALPAVWLVRRRYALFAHSARLTTLMWALFALLHFGVLLPVSLMTNTNINYMMMPFNGYPKALVPQLYRHVVTAACLGLTFLMRLGYVGGIVWATGASADAAAEMKHAEAVGGAPAAVAAAGSPGDGERSQLGGAGATPQAPVAMVAGTPRTLRQRKIG